MICTLCPHLCDLADGETGKCLVRQRNGWEIDLTQWGRVSLLSVEPIEKRPFFHFLPGSKFLAVGFYGCSFSCKFCQNFSVSQTNEGKWRDLDPCQLIDLYYEKEADGIAFTFNEPTVHFEYLMEVGERISPVVIKTNGYINIEPLRDLAASIDAFNVDIKGDDAEYERICGGRLKPVKESVEFLVGSDSHLEISYLVLPRLINDLDYHRNMRDWLYSLNPRIPIHMLYFYPFHQMTEESYEFDGLLKVVELFREKMSFVYVSNYYRKEMLHLRDTHCPKCGSLMVSRQKGVQTYKTRCCDEAIAGIYE